MKKLMITLAVALTAIAVFAEEAKPAKRQLTEQERKERREKHYRLRAQRLAEAGGLVTKKAEGRALRVFNAQDAVASGVIARAVERVRDVATVAMETQDLAAGKTPFDTVEAALKVKDTGAAVVVTDAGSLPNVLVAPEKCWAIVNVAALGADFPPKAVLETRIEKEVVRACAWALGAGDAMQGKCIMNFEPTLADLDANKLLLPSPDPMMRMVNGAIARKIQPLRRTTYRQACEEGWAPQPTNDAQKAVWKQVHELPTDPIKIKFDPKRDK